MPILKIKEEPFLITNLIDAGNHLSNLTSKPEELNE
jgi:hypothetical protein